MTQKKRFRIRDIFIKYPLLDKLRIETIATFFDKGISMLDDSYRTTALISPAAQEYVGAVNMGKKGPVFKSTKPCIFAYYHGQMVALMALNPRSQMTTLASNSRDGEMIARAAARMGFGIARGSKTHGGFKAGLELMRESEKNHCILFNVDGPRGPKHIVKDSIIRIAEMSGLPIVPVVCDASKKLTMNSWDNYICPFLNARMVYIFADPIHVPGDSTDEDREYLRQKLEERLRISNSHLAAFWDLKI